jgi:hypothetical protein
VFNKHREERGAFALKNQGTAHRHGKTPVPSGSRISSCNSLAFSDRFSPADKVALFGALASSHRGKVEHQPAGLVIAPALTRVFNDTTNFADRLVPIRASL